MKTAVVYCPKHAGLKSADKRWQKIASSLERHEVEYDLVESESAEGVEPLVGKLISQSYDTIIICGGDQALNGAANCLMKQEREVRERVALGVIPNGMMNDFALFWGFKDTDIDYAVRSIKQRRIRKIDAGCIAYTDNDGREQKRYFLNCINVGVVAEVQYLRKKIRRIFWSRRLSFIISLIVLLFKRKFWKMEYTINYDKEAHNVISLCVGSALGFGQTPNAVPYSGLLDVTVIMHSPLSHLTYGAGLFLLGKLLNYKSLRPYRCHDVTISCPRKTPFSIDGHRLLGVDASQKPVRLYVEGEEIQFIIECTK